MVSATFRFYEELNDFLPAERPFTLCVHCNLPLHELDTELARARVPPRAAWLYSRFLVCDGCQRIY